MVPKPSGGSRLFLLLALLVLAGCQEQQQIRHYLAPKEATPEPPARMLAVMVPHGKDVWFFKFDGRSREVAQHEADFDAFVRSVRFQDKEDAPLTWTDLPGWRRKSGPPPRYATLYTGRRDKRLEITITKLDSKAADVRANLDRWRGQLDLAPLTDAEFEKLLNNSVVGGVKATRVDFAGALKMDAAPMMGQPRQPAKRDQAPFKYATPEGWEPRPPIEKQGIPIPVVFRIKSGGSEAEATAMPLAGTGGGVSSNVNRWRRQAGLNALDDTELRRSLRSVKVADKEADYVDVNGPKQRILGVILPQGRQTWFFTLKGPADLVGREQSHFESFVKSVRFDGEVGAAHE